jgi:Flp pilus assembly pilin Flp
MLQILMSVQLLTGDLLGRLRARARDDRGQSTAEYALVLLGAAAIALLLVAWATKTDKITDLLDGVVDKVLEQVS